MARSEADEGKREEEPETDIGGVFEFIAVASVAAPRPRLAKYTAATAFGMLVTAARTTPADDRGLGIRHQHRPRSSPVRSIDDGESSTTATSDERGQTALSGSPLRRGGV